jgi:hypothetical protein
MDGWLLFVPPAWLVARFDSIPADTGREDTGEWQNYAIPTALKIFSEKMMRDKTGSQISESGRLAYRWNCNALKRRRTARGGI